MVSVVIPAYNSGEFLARAIESALAQDYPNKEIIVVDDGSRDNTREVARAFEAQARYVFQENAGPGAARNRGIRESKGEFIAFLDSDDEWTPGRLAYGLHPMIERPGIEMTYGWTLERTPDGREYVHGLEHERRRVFPRVLWPPNVQTTPATTCRRAVLDKVGGFDEALRSYEDKDLWIRIEEEAAVSEIAEPLNIRRLRRESLSAQTPIEQAERDYFTVLERALARKPGRYAPYRRAIMADAWLEWGIGYFIVGRNREARARLARSLRQQPSGCAGFYLLASLVPASLTMAVKRLKGRVQAP